MASTVVTEPTAGSWLPLQLTPEARLVFIQRSMFPAPDPKKDDKTTEPAVVEDEDPNKMPIVCCHLKLVDHLSSMTFAEPWGIHNWALQVYLRETFCRLIQQNSVYAYYPTGISDPTSLVFNTGLLTTSMIPIYCIIVPTTFQGANMPPWMRGVPWMVHNFYEASHLYEAPKWTAIRRKCSSLGQNLDASALDPRNMPRRASFFDSDIALSNCVYDERIPISEDRISVEEILGLLDQSDDEIRKRKARLPPRYRELSPVQLLANIKQGLVGTHLRLSTQPRCAVPVFTRSKLDPTTGTVDLIVPINLSGEPEADCAIILNRRTTDVGSQYYHITRIVDLKWARAIARVLQPVDQDWLERAFAPRPGFEPTPAQSPDWASRGRGAGRGMLGAERFSPYPSRPPAGRGGMVDRNEPAPQLGQSQQQSPQQQPAPTQVAPGQAPRLSERLGEMGQYALYVDVPLYLVPLVIGKQGSVIQRISKETNTNIVSPKKDQDPVFYVTGNTMEVVNDARQRIITIIQQAQASGQYDANAYGYQGQGYGQNYGQGGYGGSDQGFGASYYSNQFSQQSAQQGGYQSFSGSQQQQQQQQQPQTSGQQPTQQQQYNAAGYGGSGYYGSQQGY